MFGNQCAGALIIDCDGWHVGHATPGEYHRHARGLQQAKRLRRALGPDKHQSINPAAEQRPHRLGFSAAVVVMRRHQKLVAFGRPRLVAWRAAPARKSHCRELAQPHRWSSNGPRRAPAPRHPGCSQAAGRWRAPAPVSLQTRAPAGQWRATPWPETHRHPWLRQSGEACVVTPCGRYD